MSGRSVIGAVNIMGGWYEPPPYNPPPYNPPPYNPPMYEPHIVGYCERLGSLESSQSIYMRWDAMFDDENYICDPFHDGSVIDTFEIQPSLFLKRALRNAPKRAGTTVSAFADWVYSLYRSSIKDPLALELGLKVERTIFQERSVLIKDVSFAQNNYFDWELVHNGLNYATNDECSLSSSFDISDLSIEGKPIRGNPDLIYRNRNDGRYVIVEIKFTRKRIPSNLWPNVWAQLWAYSKIPILKNSPTLSAVGEVWGGNTGKSRIEWSVTYDICLRSSVSRNPRQVAFDKFFSTLFRIYRGDYGI